MKNVDLIKKVSIEINKQLAKRDKIVVTKSFQIFGPNSRLDSLIIVNFFIALEEKVKSIYGKEINLLSGDFFEKGLKSKYTISDLEKDLKKKKRN